MGCVGEYVAEYTKWRTEDARHSLGRRSLLILILGLGTGLFSLIKTNALAGLIIVSLGEQIEQAGEKAERVSGSLNLALSKTGQAQTASSDALANSTKAQTSASGALTIARGARQEADSFEKDILSAKQDASEAKALLSDARRLAAEAKQQAGEASLALATLKAPRTLNDKQVAAISESLRSFSGQEFELGTVMGGAEQTAFANRIYTTLVGGRWKFINEQVGFRNIFGDGLTVAYNPDAEIKVRDAASLLVKAFASQGINTVLTKDMSTPPSRVRIEIGEEPVKVAKP